MADHHGPLGLVGLLLELAALLQTGGDGLLHQQVVALLQSLQRHGHVLAVLGGDDGHVRQAGLFQQLLGGGEAHILRHAVLPAQNLQPLGTVVRSGDDLHPVGVLPLVGGVVLQAAVAAAADDKGQCFRHGCISPYLVFGRCMPVHTVRGAAPYRAGFPRLLKKGANRTATPFFLGFLTGYRVIPTGDQP